VEPELFLAAGDLVAARIPPEATELAAAIRMRAGEQARVVAGIPPLLGRR
jgi:hypothetical protein